MTVAMFYAHLTQLARDESIDIPQILSQARALGVRALDVGYDEAASSPRAFAGALAQSGMTCACMNRFFSFQNGIVPGMAEETLDAAQALRCAQILAIPGFYLDKNDPERKQKTAKMTEGLADLCMRAQSRGITVSIEDFDSPLSPTDTLEGLEAFLHAIPALRFTLDTGNLLFAGQTALQALERFGDRVVHVHCKDFALIPEYAGEQAKNAYDGTPLYPSSVGGGIADIAKVIDGLRARGYDGALSIEAYNHEHMRQVLVRSSAFLSREVAL